MPYNYKGDLYKSEVLDRLNARGCNIKNVHELNLIMEKMGIQVQSGNHWIPTQTGFKYTIYNCPVVDANAWHPSIVDLVFNYLSR